MSENQYNKWCIDRSRQAEIYMTGVAWRQAVLIALLVTTGCGGWSRQDTLLELHSLAWNVADARQTQQVLAAGLHDQNMVLDSAVGAGVPLAGYEAGVLVGHALVSALLPRGKWRTAWQLTSAGVEAVVVVRNYELGWRP